MKIVRFGLTTTTELVQSLVDCYREVFRAPPWNEDWWTDSLVMDELEQYDNRWSASVVALDDSGRVVGFHWGAAYEASELQNELGLNVPSLSGTVLYQKDLGVLEEFRRHGLAKSMINPLLNELHGIADKADYVVARTMGLPEPSVVFDWFQNEFDYSVLAEYPGDDNRVVMGKSYST